MARMPREPEAFAEQVAVMFQRVSPGHAVECSGCFELTIDGRRLELQNLYRMVNRVPQRGVEIVEEYLDHLLEGESAAATPLPLDVARHHFMPRIQPETIFEHLDQEQIVYSPFVNDTVILYVIDLPHVTVSITTEQRLQWDLSIDDIDQIARGNLLEYNHELNAKLVTSDEGGRTIILAEQDGYDASRLLLHNLHRNLSPQLGRQFLVATPARDTFFALSIEPEDFSHRLHERIEQEYKRLPYPITSRYFLVTMDGIAGTVAA